MAGGVVLNQNRSLPAVPQSELFEESEVRAGIEDGVLAVVEPCAPRFDGAENLHTFAFSGYGDFRWTPDAARAECASKEAMESAD